MSEPICSSTGKVQYTGSEAQAAAKVLGRIHGARQHVYRCGECGAHHLTKQDQARRRSRVR